METSVKFILIFSIMSFFGCQKDINNGTQSVPRNIVGGWTVPVSPTIALEKAIRSQTVNIIQEYANVRGFYYKQFCTGTILSSEYVLTAKHCFGDTTQFDSYPLFYIYLGNTADYSWDSNLNLAKRRRITGQINIASYNSTTGEDDLVLLRYTGGMPSGGQAASLLNSSFIYPNVFSRLTIAGYGSVESGVSATLKMAQYSLPAAAYLTFYTLSKLFTIEPYSTKGICYGDVGGPTYLQDNQNTIIQAGVNGANQCGGIYRAAYIPDYTNAIKNVVGTALKTRYFTVSKKIEGSFCINGNIYHGDFDGNGTGDLMCHYPNRTGYMEIKHSRRDGYIGDITWQARPSDHFCEAPGKLEIGDFNGDKKSDALCVSNSKTWTLFSNGLFPTWDIQDPNSPQFCNGPGGRVRVGDFNGDGKDDAVCVATNGSTWQLFANAQGNLSWVGAFSHTDPNDPYFCPLTNVRLIAADFNGDKRTDLACSEIDTGHLKILYANTSGELSRVGAYSQETSEFLCKGSGGQVKAGYFNGDNKADLGCFAGNANVTILYSDTYGHPVWDVNTKSLTNHFCRSDTNSNFVSVGKLNPDGRSDAICLNPINGDHWVFYGSPTTNVPDLNPSWF